MTSYTVAPLFGTATETPCASYDAAIDAAHVPARYPVLIRADGRPFAVVCGSYAEWGPRWNLSIDTAGQEVWYAVQAGGDADTAVHAIARQLCDRLQIADAETVPRTVRAAFERLAQETSAPGA